MLKIRLRRTGAKFQPTYRLVVADSRAPRDGAFVAILGFYNPRAEPPTIQINEAELRQWVSKGAQPTDSVLSLLQTAHMAPDLLARYNPRLIGAGGKRGVTAAPATDTVAPVAVAPAAATPAPAATAPAATPTPAEIAPVAITPVVETPAPVETPVVAEM